MKKLIFLLPLLLYSCNHKEADTTEANYIGTNSTREIAYLKDYKTGLCYAASGYGLTCVPCDSLKKAKILM